MITSTVAGLVGRVPPDRVNLYGVTPAGFSTMTVKIANNRDAVVPPLEVKLRVLRANLGVRVPFVCVIVGTTQAVLAPLNNMVT